MTLHEKTWIHQNFLLTPAELVPHELFILGFKTLALSGSISGDKIGLLKGFVAFVSW